MRHASSSASSSAMLVHAGALGDFVLALRLVAVLRATGARTVTVLGRPAIAGVAIGSGVDRVLDLDTGGFHSLFSADSTAPPHLVPLLAGHGRVINMLTDATSPLTRQLAALCGGRVVCVDSRLRPDWRGHVTDQWLSDLRAAGLAAESDRVGPPMIDLAPAARSAARRALCPGGGTCVVIHPGSGGRTKCWPLSRFIELAEGLRAAGRGVVAVLGPVELERWGDAERDALRRVATVREGPPLTELAAWLAAAEAYVGNDSGVSHLAAAVGAATVAIFGATNPAHWHPLGPRVQVLGGAAWPTVDAVERVLAESMTGRSL